MELMTGPRPTFSRLSSLSNWGGLLLLTLAPGLTGYGQYVLSQNAVRPGWWFLAGAVSAVLGAILRRGPKPVWVFPERVPIAWKRWLLAVPAILLSITVFLWVLKGNSSRVAVFLWLVSLLALFLPIAVKRIVEIREKRSGEDRPGRLLFPRVWRRRHVLEGLTLILLLLVAFSFRLPYLERFPILVHVDEGNSGLMSREIEAEWKAGAVDWFRPRSFYGFNTLGFVPGAAFQAIFETDLYGLRIQNVILGMLALALLYPVLRGLFGPLPALFVIGLGTTAHCAVEWSRNGIHVGHVPFLTSLCVFLLWKGARTGKALWFLLTGFSLGACLLTYTAAVAIPLWIACVAGVFWVCSKQFRRTYTGGLLLCVLGAIVFLSPVLGSHAKLHHGPSGRSSTLIFTQDPNSIRHMKSGYGEDYLDAIFKANLKNMVLLFNKTVDTSTQYGYKLGGFVDPLTASLLVAGLAVALIRFPRFDTWPWLVGLLIPWVFGGLLTMDAPQYPRLAGVVLIVGVLPMYWLRAWLGALRGVAGRWGLRLGALVATVLLVLIGWKNFDLYFRDYDTQNRPLKDFEVALIIREMDRLGAGNITYVYEPYFRHNFLERQHLFVAGANRGESFTQLERVDLPPPGEWRTATFILPPRENGILRALLEKFPSGKIRTVEVPFREQATILTAFEVDL